MKGLLEKHKKQKRWGLESTTHPKNVAPPHAKLTDHLTLCACFATRTLEIMRQLGVGQ